MAIWMDMTNSLRCWQGGVVGIVRAELEIAKNLKKIYPDIRFSLFDGYKFIEVPDERLNWLWNAKSVGDEYIEAMGRKKKDNEETVDLTKEYPQLREAYMYSTSRLARVLYATDLYLDTVPKIIAVPLRGIRKLVGKPLTKLADYRFIRRQKKIAGKDGTQDKEFTHPYKDGDIIFSCGWMQSQKEDGFSKIKTNKNIKLVYLVYDIILIKPETKQFYSEEGERYFRNYFEWISNNCDYILYGGATAERDSKEYQVANNLPSPKSAPIKFGSDILRVEGKVNREDILKKYKIKSDYILMVGSIDARKNYSTIYRAYTIMMDRNTISYIPELVIVGKGDAYVDLVDSIKRDPRTKDKIKIISPTDAELDLLYRNCRFVLLASSYEGWSLTLPEALAYNKFCLVSDVAPLREIGEDLVEYIDTFDPFAWAERIEYYATNDKKLKAREEAIKEKWQVITWYDCAQQVYNELIKQDCNSATNKGDIYFDLSTAWSLSFLAGSRPSGILRSELMLVRYLNILLPNIKYFAYNDIYGYQAISKAQLQYIFGTLGIDEAYEMSRSKLAVISNLEVQSTGKVRHPNKARSFWMFCSIFQAKTQQKIIKLKERLSGSSDEPKESKNISIEDIPFKKNDIVFCAGSKGQKKVFDIMREAKEKIGFKYAQIVYDFTPMLIPQAHVIETVKGTMQFIDFVSETADLIFYGGATAMRDGLRYQEERKLPSPKGIPVKFGCDIIKTALTEDDDEDILKRLGIKSEFIIAVGTIEIRKNYETLYRAYLRLINKKLEDIPQLIICGYRSGWKVNDFLNEFSRDERIKNKIIIITPTDEELDVLYRHAQFTILASLYEGWSLTLPQSLGYGKFCLASDVDPLREIGRDLIEYIHPWDEIKWAERIYYYATHKEEIEKREVKIRQEWHSITWKDFANQIYEGLIDIQN